MFRRLVNTAGTVAAALSVLTIGTCVYHHGAVAALGRAWDFRPPAAAHAPPTATPVVGVDVASTAVSAASPTAPPAAAPPTPAPTATLTALVAECRWSADIMRLDARNDRAAIATYGMADYYNRVAGWWDTIAGWIDARCAPTWSPQQCRDATAWLDFGRSTHETTGSAVPHDAAWDATWIGYYRRVGRLVAQVCA